MNLRSDDSIANEELLGVRDNSNLQDAINTGGGSVAHNFQIALAICMWKPSDEIGGAFDGDLEAIV